MKKLRYFDDSQNKTNYESTLDQEPKKGKLQIPDEGLVASVRSQFMLTSTGNKEIFPEPCSGGNGMPRE